MSRAHGWANRPPQAKVEASAEERRRLKLSLTRVGAANGIKVDVYEDDRFLYARLAEDQS